MSEKEIAKLRADVDNLTGWQKKQNSDVAETNKKVDEMNERFDSRFEKLQYWLLGISTGVALQLLVAFLLLAGGG